MSELAPGDAQAVVAVMGDEGELAGLRLARGCRCFVARAGNEVIAYGWLSSGAEWIGEVRLEISPGAGEAYVWNCLTLPEHRRRGAFGALVLRISTVLREEGVSRLWIASGVGGADSALPAAGYRPVLLVAVSQLGLAGLRLVRATAAPGPDPSLVAAGRRALGGGRPISPSALARRAPSRRH